MTFKQQRITKLHMLCPAYNEPDQPGIANVTKRINEIKANENTS